jgi:hypothetical protein
MVLIAYFLSLDLVLLGGDSNCPEGALDYVPGR